jgi:hypothetical protein
VRGLGLAVLLAALTACASDGPPGAADLEQRLRDDAVTDLRTDRFELTSPFDAAGTAEFARVVGRELGLVEGLLGDPGGDPIRVHLVAVDPDSADTGDAQLCSLFPSRNGLSGAALGGSFVFVYVTAPGAGPPAMVQAELRHEVIRHELVHVVAHRAGLAGPTWFDEGLALEIDAMDADDGRLRERDFPAALVAARKTAARGTVAALLAWTHADDLTRAERAVRYDQSQALLRFLVARTPGGTFADRVRRVHALGGEAIVALEPEWLRWLQSLDALAAIRAEAVRPDARDRARGAALLPVLAERGAPELASRAADELALSLLADAATRESAATFLLFFRTKDLTPGDVASLRGAGDPAVALVGEALAAKRGEPFDARRAQTIFDGIPAAERSASTIAAHVLGLTQPGYGPADR